MRPGAGTGAGAAAKGPGLAVHLQPDHRFGGRVALCGLGDGDEFRGVDGRNAVTRRATGQDLVVVNDGAAEVTERKFTVPRTRVVLRGEQGLRAGDAVPQCGQQGERYRCNSGKAELADKGQRHVLDPRTGVMTHTPRTMRPRLSLKFVSQLRKGAVAFAWRRVEGLSGAWAQMAQGLLKT